MDIFLNLLIQVYSNSVTNPHCLISLYAVLPLNTESVIWSAITVTSLHSSHYVYAIYATLQTANSWTNQVADWISCGLNKLQTTRD